MVCACDTISAANKGDRRLGDRIPVSGPSRSMIRDRTRMDRSTPRSPPLITADAELARRHQILTRIAGVRNPTANQVIATMPELGSLDCKQAASHAGLAPVARQSGQ